MSDIELRWYKEYWIHTTKSIDYSIDSLWEEQGRAMIRLERKGKMPMPIDVKVTYKDGSESWHNIPLNLMFGAKKPEVDGTKIEASWNWTHPTYSFTLPKSLFEVKSVEIDPSKRMADIDHKNNTLMLNW